jgi:hypothetical protein
MDIGKLMNPFATWVDLARGLRDRFVIELGEERPFSPYRDDVLDELAEMITHCESLGVSLQRLHQHDPEVFDAFVRALEMS